MKSPLFGSIDTSGGASSHASQEQDGATFNTADNTILLIINSKRYIVSSQSVDVQQKMKEICQKFHESILNHEDGFGDCIEFASKDVYQCKLHNQDNSVVFYKKDDNSVVKTILLSTIKKTHTAATSILNPKGPDDDAQVDDPEIHIRVKPNPHVTLHVTSAPSPVHTSPKQQLESTLNRILAKDSLRISTGKEYSHDSAEIQALSKLEEIDLNNPKHVEQLTHFYAKMCSVHEEKDPQKLVSLFGSKDFSRALDLCIHYFTNLSATSRSSQGDEIQEMFNNIRRKQMAINLANLSESANLNYNNPEEDVERMNTTTELILTSIKSSFTGQERENRIEDFKKQQIHFIQSLLKKEDINVIKKLDYFLRVAQFCSKEQNTFTVHCIYDAMKQSRPRVMEEAQAARYDAVLSELSKLTTSTDNTDKTAKSDKAAHEDENVESMEKTHEKLKKAFNDADRFESEALSSMKAVERIKQRATSLGLTITPEEQRDFESAHQRSEEAYMRVREARVALDAFEKEHGLQ